MQIVCKWIWSNRCSTKIPGVMWAGFYDVWWTQQINFKYLENSSYNQIAMFILVISKVIFMSFGVIAQYEYFIAFKNAEVQSFHHKVLKSTVTAKQSYPVSKWNIIPALFLFQFETFVVVVKSTLIGFTVIQCQVSHLMVQEQCPQCTV
jgi:hypothetical protein